MTRHISRRTYLKSTAALAAGLTILPARSARAYAANEKINIGIIGAGGRGAANLKGIGGEKAGDGENIVALCDVDRGALERTRQAASRPPESTRTSASSSKRPKTSTPWS